MPRKGSKKYNIDTKIYNESIGYDSSIPDEARFQTAISMPKKTYLQIDMIKSVTHNKSRSDIITRAIQHYTDYIASPQYFEDMRSKLKVKG